MVITKEFTLPPEEELNVQEVNLSTSALLAGAFHLGKHCEYKNNEFMLCRKEFNKDPRKCVNEGKDVTACSLDFFRKVKKHCLEEFNQYANCLDLSNRSYSYSYCRKTQAVFDACMLQKLNIERPEYGYFCEVKVHDSKRPKPPAPQKTVYEDAAPALPAEHPRPEAKFGSRFYWLYE